MLAGSISLVNGINKAHRSRLVRLFLKERIVNPFFLHCKHFDIAFYGYMWYNQEKTCWEKVIHGKKVIHNNGSINNNT